MSNEPKLWDKRIEFIEGLLLIAAHENEDKITITTSAIADLIHDRSLYKQQVDELERGLKAINDYVFCNLLIPVEHRSNIQRIIHYNIPVALESLGEEQSNDHP